MTVSNNSMMLNLSSFVHLGQMKTYLRFTQRWINSLNEPTTLRILALFSSTTATNLPKQLSIYSWYFLFYISINEMVRIEGQTENTVPSTNLSWREETFCYLNEIRAIEETLRLFFGPLRFRAEASTTALLFRLNIVEKILYLMS